MWNQVFSGDPGAPAQSFSATSGLAGGTAPYTTLATSPVTQEEPFLQTDFGGPVQRLRAGPAAQLLRAVLGQRARRGLGPSRSASSSSPRRAPRCWPSTRPWPSGKNLILTPGVYDLKAPILVTRPNTIVLGLGFPTLVPQNGTAAMQVLGVPGVKLSGMIFDAGPENSPVLLQVGGPLAAGDRQRRRSHAGAGRVLPHRRGHGGLGHRQPGGQQLPRHPRRHLGLAGGSRRGRGLDQQHRRHRPHRQRQRRDRLRPVRRALPEERGHLERPGRRRTSSSRTRCPTTRPARPRGCPAPPRTATRPSSSRPR